MLPAVLIVAVKWVAGGVAVGVLGWKARELVRQCRGGRGRRPDNLPQLFAQEDKALVPARDLKTPAPEKDHKAHQVARTPHFHNPGFEKGRFIRSLPEVSPYTGELRSHHPLGWEIDRAVLERMMGSKPSLRDDLELGAGLLISSLKQHVILDKDHKFSSVQPNRLLDRYNEYSSTFASSLLDVHGNFTPEDAIKAFTEEFYKNGMSNKAIYILGGLFIVGTEAERAHTEQQLKTVERWGKELMASGTPQDTSRLTWKFTVWAKSFVKKPKEAKGPDAKGPKAVTAKDLRKSFGAIATRNPPHGRLIVLSPTPVNSPPPGIVVPTTFYGSSATIMKVMKKCEALGMNQEQCESVAFAVAQHWLDKHLNGRRDRHSLIEALQGALTYLGNSEDQANRMMEQEIRRLGARLYAKPMEGYIKITDLSRI